MIHEVKSHLHYARRARMRLELKRLIINRREERFQTGKIKSVLNSVIHSTTFCRISKLLVILLYSEVLILT
jgi:hypothetical protein